MCGTNVDEHRFLTCGRKSFEFCWINLGVCVCVVFVAIRFIPKNQREKIHLHTQTHSCFILGSSLLLRLQHNTNRLPFEEVCSQRGVPEGFSDLLHIFTAMLYFVYFGTALKTNHINMCLNKIEPKLF